MKYSLAVLALAGIALAGCTKTTVTNNTAGGTQGSSAEVSQTATGPVTTRVNSFTKPHVLRFATAGDINTLNPHLGQFADIGLLSSLTMAWLIKWDVNNNPYPELATSVPTQANGGVSKDGLTITYHLRKGVKWSDGVPFTADDVVFSTQVVLNPANNEVSRLGWDQIAKNSDGTPKLDEPDKYTVVFHLSKPYSPFIVTFFSSAGANPCILPKHLLAQYPNINNVAYNSLPVGIGPFKYVRWDRANKVVMVANPLYWRGLPKLKEIDYMIVPNRDTVLTQIQGHTLDMWYLAAGHYLPLLKAVPQYTIIRLPSYYFNHIDFNLAHPAMQDPAVRQALRLAIDRATLRHKIGNDVGYLQEEIASRRAPYWDPNIQLVPFDIAQANALLDKAGWMRGPGGIRSKNGVKLDLTYATSTGLPDVDEQIELIRSWWKQIGVSLSVKHYPAPLMFAPLENGGIVYGGKWDVINFAWGLDPIGDFSTIYGCGSFPPAGQNNVHWCNKRANAAMQAVYTHYDQAQRNKDDAIVMEEMAKDVPIVVTTGREDLYPVNRDLRNFAPNDVSPFDNFMNVDI